MKKLLLFFLLFIAIPVNASTTKTVYFDKEWNNSSKSTINSGKAELTTPDNSNNITVAINPYGNNQNYKRFELNNGVSSDYANAAFASALKLNLLEEGYSVLLLSNFELDDIARMLIANHYADMYIAIEHEDKTTASGISCKYLQTGNTKLNESSIKTINNKSEELCSNILSSLKTNGVTLENQTGIRDEMNEEIRYAEIPATTLVVGDKTTVANGTAFATTTSLVATSIIKHASEASKDSTTGLSTTRTEEISFNDESLSEDAKKMLEDVSKSWPSNISKGRVELIKKAASLIGKVKYAWGGGHSEAAIANPNPTGLDCSGFVSWSFYQSGYVIGVKTTTGLVSDREHFDVISQTGIPSNIEPGDVIVKHGGSSDNHTMIYIGKDSSGQMKIIHSTTTSIDGVQFGNVRTTDKYVLRYKNWPDEVYTNSNSSSSNSNKKLVNGSTTDKYKNLFSSLSLNNVEAHCDSILYYEGEKTPLKKFLDLVYVIIKLLVPTITIILSILDYSKSLLDPNNADGKKVTKKMIIRIIIGVIIFILPEILELLFHAFGLYDLSVCTGIGVGE